MWNEEGGDGEHRVVPSELDLVASSSPSSSPSSSTCEVDGVSSRF